MHIIATNKVSLDSKHVSLQLESYAEIYNIFFISVKVTRRIVENNCVPKNDVNNTKTLLHSPQTHTTQKAGHQNMPQYVTYLPIIKYYEEN